MKLFVRSIPSAAAGNLTPKAIAKYTMNLFTVRQNLLIAVGSLVLFAVMLVLTAMALVGPVQAINP